MAVFKRAALVAIVVVAFLGMSCNTNCKDPKNAQSAACVIEGAVVDCTGVTSLPSAVAVVSPVVDKLVDSATQANGSINWPSIEGQLVNIALQYGMCVLSEIWNQLTGGGGAGSAGSAGSATLSSSSRRAPLNGAAEAFERIRSRVAPGRQFKTLSGTL
jgi:hypothetical protein